MFRLRPRSGYLLGWQYRGSRLTKSGILRKNAHFLAQQKKAGVAAGLLAASLRAFSSEVETGSRQENASKQKARASVPIQSERKRL
jgi:hypothetical protein